jgi:hypothetical protein
MQWRVACGSWPQEMMIRVVSMYCKKIEMLFLQYPIYSVLHQTHPTRLRILK